MEETQRRWEEVASLIMVVLTDNWKVNTNKYVEIVTCNVIAFFGVQRWKISFRNAEWKFKEMLWHLEVFIDHFLVEPSAFCTIFLWDLDWKYSARWEPSIWRCRLLSALQRAGMTDLDQTFCMWYFSCIWRAASIFFSYVGNKKRSTPSWHNDCWCQLRLSNKKVEEINLL